MDNSDRPAAPRRDVFGKRRAILDGARRIFARHGYDGTSIDNLIAEAGVARRTLYQHFSGKEDVFAALIREQCDQWVAQLHHWPRETDPKRALSDFAYKMLRSVMSDESLDLYRLVIAESARFPELGRAFYESGQGISGPALAGYLAEQTILGTLSIDDPQHAADLFLAMTNATLRLKYLVGVTDRPSARQCRDWADQTVMFFLAGCHYRPTATFEGVQS